MSDIVLDASALIAMIKGERGAAKVAGAIASARMSAVNYAEVVSHFVHAGMPSAQVDAMLGPYRSPWSLRTRRSRRLQADYAA